MNLAMSLRGCFVAFHDSDWTRGACDRYVLFPEALKLVTTFVIGGSYSIARSQNRELNQASHLYFASICHLLPENGHCDIWGSALSCRAGGQDCMSLKLIQDEIL